MASVIKTAATFSFLSPLCILAGVPIAAGLRGVGGPGPIDFGSGEVLTQLAMAAPRTAWVDTLALIGPVLALPVGAGWYVLLDDQRPLAALGTLLWYLGMVFVIAQDAMQLAVVATLPSAYVAADPSIKPALEAFGHTLAFIIEVIAAVGAMSGAGFIILSLLMMRSPRIPKWIAILGLVSNAVAILSTGARFLAPDVEFLRLGVPIGILLFVVVCIPALGVVMFRWTGLTT